MFFYNTLKIDNIQGVDFKYGNVFFKFLPKNAKKGFFGPKFRHYFFGKYLEIDKFEGVYFKYNNNFRKILAHKKPNKAFFVPNLDNSFFGQILFISNITIILGKF